MNIVLLDRDGTVIIDPPDGRVDEIAKIKLFPDSIEALKYLADHDFAVIFVTNQTGIAEKRMTEASFWDTHDEVVRRLSPSGVKILKTYMNGEGPGPDTSDWRKPGPNMLLQAAKDLKFDLQDVYMVGDNQSDIEAAIRAGCKGGILVETATNKKVTSPDAVYSAPCLMDAARYIVKNS